MQITFVKGIDCIACFMIYFEKVLMLGILVHRILYK
jgi:hypothetical protein